MILLDRILAIPFIDKLRKHTFVRSVLVSVIATITDYAVALSMHHLFHYEEVLSTTVGSSIGAIVSFYMNRWWAFKSKDGKLSTQAIKYLVTLAISIFLNSTGVYFLKEYAGLPFFIERIIVTILVGVFVNYQLFKRFVFK